MNAKKMFKPSQLALATAFALGLAGQAAASETASNMRGAIVGPNGQAVTDAAITIIHQPTGTVTEVTVNENGNFNARGLRVGGPYAVIVSSDTYQDEYQEGLYIGVGETLRFNSQLQTNEGVERITITGSALPFRTGGSNSEFGEDDIANAPGTSRDLKDVLRQNGMVNVDASGTMSVAGINPKFNSFVVDGVQQNDDFGLNSNGYPTQRSPISIDAVESVALNVTPYSARYGGFSGAQVNAVTKSGTNEVSGTMFYEYSSDSLSGSEEEFRETTWGATLGMPLIKDRLFFFGSYERFDEPSTVDYRPGENHGVSLDEAERIRDIANRVYGINDIGSWDYDTDTKDEKILAKLDWNINDDHRASFTYQHTDGYDTRNDSYDARIQTDTYAYQFRNELTTYAFNLYSDWTHNLSTDLKVSYKDQRNESNSLRENDLGQINVQTESGEFRFGTESNRHANELDNQNLELRFVADYQLGDHALAFGVQHNRLHIFNLYANDSRGQWTFASIDDFENRQLDFFRESGDFNYEAFKWQGTASGDINDGAAEFDMNTTALFVEDTWDVNYDLELTFGLRYERHDMNDRPELNQNFVDRYGFDNTATFDGQDIWLPRVGAKYQLTDNVSLRGGVGRFAGGYPNVWMSNSFQNDGYTLLRGDLSNLPAGMFDPRTGQWLGDLALADDMHKYLEPGDGYVNALDHDFKLASDWRYSVGFDATLDLGAMGDDWYFGGEFLHIMRENDIKYVDLARQAVTDADGNVQTDFMGRTLYRHYDALADDPYNTNRYDLLLTNADEDGYSQVLNLSLSKQFDNGLRFATSYTFQNVEEGNQGSSSQASSNYQYVVSDFDRHSTNLGTSPYEIPHRITLTLGYDVELFAGYNSSFNLFYEAKSGDNYSYTMSQKGGFDSRNLETDYLAYIPSADDVASGRVVFADGVEQKFWDMIEDKGLMGKQGQMLTKGDQSLDWTHRMDFRFLQQIPGVIPGHKAELYFDIKNVLNLLNSDWGEYAYSRFGSTSLYNYEYLDADTIMITRANDFYDVETIDERASNWEMKLGVRYRF
ncbi:TonB-dependent receptor [Ferrimonas marina]|uniref:TonB-dependent Receptor Plug Domain n=1 Tax=Ferrimonas marina TaxID=299255 RepID=A0A1M5YRT2_9GAMM|nr:TonB-dependent receptor [Ferrimonas marina]SHI14762.1 TonB-dependent Receptor Plug Domain [Ferrimonas marina]